LALVAALTGEADCVFIPEWPPAADWPVKMCHMLRQASNFEIKRSPFRNHGLSLWLFQIIKKYGKSLSAV
jgi:hypothetical protein